MVKHIIIWEFNDELSGEQRTAAACRIKRELEALQGVIKGLRSIKVYTDMLPTSNGDIMLESLFDDTAALEYYADHPEHLKVKQYISQTVKSRKCADFEV